MKVLLTGATGFVGGAICAELLKRGHLVYGAAREPGAQPSVSGLTWFKADFSRAQEPADWFEAVNSVDAVVNAVGIIRETSRQKFLALHALAPLALFSAAREAGVTRLIQISASGVTGASHYEYFRTKAQADDALLAESASDALVLRPSLIYGEDGQSAQLFRQLASLPLVPLIGDGSYLFRPILVEDLARLVVDALESESMPHGAVEIGGQEALSLRELLLSLREWLKGKLRDVGGGEVSSGGPFLPVPLFLMRAVARLGSITGQGPLDSDMLGMMLQSEAADIGPQTHFFSFRPRSLRAYLRDNPCSPVVRQYAGMCNVRLPLRLLVASIWIITPAVSLSQWNASLQLLRNASVPESALSALLVLSCSLELLIAAAIFARFQVLLVGLLQMAMVVFYTVFLSATSPELWLDPFGPLSKNLPLLGAIWALMVLDERAPPAPLGRARRD